MTTATVAAQGVSQQEPCVVLNGITWGQYEKILEAFPEQSGLRITYLDGRLTLLSPKRRHDWHEDTLGDLVKAVASGLGIGWEPSGHTTYRRKDVGGGVEGDQTFYFGVNAETMRGPIDVDLTTQPPPDLAIEVEVTHRADDSVAVWGRLGVPEVWRFNVDRGTLTFETLRGDGTYAPIPRSVALPELKPDDVIAQLRLAGEIGVSRWYSELGDWVRTVLLPRRGV